MVKDIHTHEWWLPFLTEYQQSGKTIKDYCKEKGFNYDAFYRHLRREQREAVDDGSSDCYEVLPVTVTDHTSEFIRVEINGVNTSGLRSMELTSAEVRMTFAGFWGSDYETGKR